ncbi:aminoglycoside phosphotransferase family protein [Paenibacillus sp. Leaf72]|uniref:aminoglycoside phosphotransferase family protein n=1 Tax=Paenibacillus sp. Leaf72 TaxID=1736234 RepID=UPI0009D73093|nr:aminoglycoside phosphotransferase family protein [Paenibacillus sp. Leaf72]
MIKQNGRSSNMAFLNEMVWAESTSFMNELLKQELACSSMPAGLEAHVWKYSSVTDSFVLKIWDKDSDPDVHFQYVLLQALWNIGISVSAAYGWGHTASGHKALLTSYDGSPLSQITNQQVEHLAQLLLDIHKVSDQELDPLLHRKYDFIRYFYPQIEEHQDIQTELIELINGSNMQQNKFIHGDFNLGNVVENQGKYTIIDWTNGQLGDVRYDFAWTSFLIYLYNGEPLATLFQNAYLAQSEFDKEEIQRFEAIACLRWLLLYRFAPVPKDESTIGRINHKIMKNKFLNKALVLE